MGRDLTDSNGRIMGDPGLSLVDGYFSYDEQPVHSVTLGAFSIMSNTVSQSDFARSGLIGDVSDVSHSTSVAFAEWYTQQQKDTSYLYRLALPTEQEWEYVRKLGIPTVIFGPREHILDWHNVYPDPPLQSSAISSYAGPTTGILKVVRDGSNKSTTTRYSVPVGATHEAFGSRVPSTTFRLVEARATSGGTNDNANVPPHSHPSFSQIGIIPVGLVTATEARRKLAVPVRPPLMWMYRN